MPAEFYSNFPSFSFFLHFYVFSGWKNRGEITASVISWKSWISVIPGLTILEDDNLLVWILWETLRCVKVEPNTNTQLTPYCLKYFKIPQILAWINEKTHNRVTVCGITGTFNISFSTLWTWSPLCRQMHCNADLQMVFTLERSLQTLKWKQLFKEKTLWDQP